MQKIVKPGEFLGKKAIRASNFCGQQSKMAAPISLMHAYPDSLSKHDRLQPWHFYLLWWVPLHWGQAAVISNQLFASR